MATSRENKTLSNFKSQLIGGGARPNLFEVELTTLPDAVQGWDSEKFRYMCKAANLPASNIANIDDHLEVVFLKLRETGHLMFGLLPSSMMKILL